MVATVIMWLVMGALAGWIGSMIAGTNQEQGAIGNIVVGILGALLGGFLARAMGIGDFTGFNLGSLVIAIIGAVILLFVYKAVRGGTTHSPSLHR